MRADFAEHAETPSDSSPAPRCRRPKLQSAGTRSTDSGQYWAPYRTRFRRERSCGFCGRYGARTLHFLGDADFCGGLQSPSPLVFRGFGSGVERRCHGPLPSSPSLLPGGLGDLSERAPGGPGPYSYTLYTPSDCVRTLILDSSARQPTGLSRRSSRVSTARKRDQLCNQSQGALTRGGQGAPIIAPAGPDRRSSVGTGIRIQPRGRSGRAKVGCGTPDHFQSSSRKSAMNHFARSPAGEPRANAQRAAAENPSALPRSTPQRPNV